MFDKINNATKTQISAEARRIARILEEDINEVNEVQS